MVCGGRQVFCQNETVKIKRSGAWCRCSLNRDRPNETFLLAGFLSQPNFLMMNGPIFEKQTTDLGAS